MGGVIYALLISLSWATLVGFIGKSDLRIWNSFFLQYLWEFVLGMVLALKYYENQNFIKIPSMLYLIIFATIGIAIVGYTGVKGGILKLYNDIPSLIGYLSLSLLIYSFKIKWISNFFIYTNKFSYEWFLVHILIFHCVFYFTKAHSPSLISGSLAMIFSFIFAIGYHQLLRKFLYNKI
jgi:peptidoglycan/LPS O-acetylase OafA/YrhL